MRKTILVMLMLGAGVTGALADESCTVTATGKKLAGAAKTSFMTKCEKDARATCDTTAAGKKLAGAAKTSFMTKCVKDAVGSS